MTNEFGLSRPIGIESRHPHASSQTKDGSLHFEVLLLGPRNRTAMDTGHKTELCWS